jgi:dihydroorotase
VAHSGSGNPRSPGRRKFLLVAAYGAANVVALRALQRSQGGGASPLGGHREDGSALPDSGRDPEAVATAPSALEGAAPAPEPGHVFDIVIANGRIMDPDSGFDGPGHVGIDGATVTAVSAAPLQGRRTIDATNLVIAPGFIDILSYDPNDYGIWYKIADGVTTNLGCHGINSRSKDFLALYESQGSPCHFGGAYDNPYMRGAGGLGIEASAAASTNQISQLVDDVRRQIDEGWIGVDFEPEYTPGITFDEIKAQAEVAVEKGVPCFFHGRYSDMQEPGTNRDTLAEILRVADETGASVHVEHITSTGGTFSMPESVATLEDARARGVDVTACMYPYDFWATYLGSPRFDDGWQDRFRITYSDLEIAGTGERLTETTFQTYRAENKLAAAYAIPDADVITGLQTPWILIGSDAILEPGNNNHPRSTGCFTRTLGRFARDQEVLSLMDALAKMTILPARRLEARAPALRKKGRLQRGADADLTVFDPAAVTDTSTVANPAQYAVGVQYVLVLGQLVKEGDVIHKDVRPGQPVVYGT